MGTANVSIIMDYTDKKMSDGCIEPVDGECEDATIAILDRDQVRHRGVGDGHQRFIMHIVSILLVFMISTFIVDSVY